MSEPDVAQLEEQAGKLNPDDNSRIRLLVLALAVGGAYYLGALIGFALTFPNSAVSTLWPPNSILLAGLLLTPTRRWWAILLGVFPAHFAVQLQTDVPMLMILCWFMSNIAEALIGAFCVRYFIRGPLKFDSFHHVGIFTTFAVILSPFVTSFLDAGFVVLNQWRQVDFWEVWKMRFHANVLASLTLVPAIVLWIRNGVASLRHASLLRSVEGCALILGLLSVASLAFTWQSSGSSALPALVYLPLPFLLWAAVRFGPRGSSTCVLILVLLSIWETVHGRGPFISSSPEQNVFFLQLFLIVVSMPVFFLAALLEERRRAEQTRAQAAAIVESSNDAIIGETLEGIITSWNRGAEKLFGYSATEVIGCPNTILMPSNGATVATHNAERINESEAILSYETVRLAKGGRPIHVSVTLSSVIDAKGRKIGASSIIRDITQRKRAESRLNAQHAVTRVLSESDSVADAAPRILQAICECLDWELGEIWRVDCETNLMTLFKSWHLPSKDLEEFASESLRFTFSPGVGLPGGVWKSGEAGWIRNLAQDKSFVRASLVATAGLRCAFGFPVVLGNETLVAMVFFSHDSREPDQDLLEMMASIGSQMGQFAERKRAEDALRESEARLQLGMEAARFGCWEVEVTTGKTMRSPSLERLLGVPPGSMGTKREAFIPFLYPEDREIPLRHLERCIETFESTDIEYRIIRPDGTIRWMASRGQAILGADGRVSRVVGMSADITERKRAEESLRESEGLRRAIFESEPECVKLVAPDCRLLDMNPAGLAMIEADRLDQVLGQSVLALVAPEWRATYKELNDRVCRGEKGFAQFEIVGLKGKRRWMESHAAPLRDRSGNLFAQLSITHDITERKRAEEELKKALAEVQRLKERLELENVYLRSEVMGAHRHGEIIGESEGIRKVLEEVERVGVTDMTVLVLGETGTGKELVARLVHEKSGRRERPLVKVNCSALPAELIESELFGHERGAFTGAVAKQVGRFELADGGTIFLDEVGELPLRLQAKLLTVLQEGEFERLGSGKTIKVDVRVIAATNRNLSEAVQRGRFRADLYYRLNVYPIEIPPLREHREDIGLLAEVFLQEAGRRLGKSFGKIPGEVIEALQGYSWPGNVRELENVIGRAAVTSTGLTLQLPDGWHQASSPELCSNPSTVVPEPFVLDKKNTQSPLTLEQFERTRILEVLNQTNWRVEGPRGAALILGLHPNTLRSRMNKLGIRRSTKPRNLVVETTK